MLEAPAGDIQDSEIFLSSLPFPLYYSEAPAGDIQNSETDPMHPKVFLSYSAKQKGFAKDLYDSLEANNINTLFFDLENHSLPPGENFLFHIFSALRRCEVCLFLLSEEFVCSKWPMMELCECFNARKGNAALQPLPLFYRLSPSDLELETNFKRWRKCWKLHFKSTGIAVSNWENALRRLSPLVGIVFNEAVEGEQAYIGRVVSAVSQIVHTDINTKMDPVKRFQISIKSPIGSSFSGRPVTLPDDGFQWRKYGMKQIKNSAGPRHYFKCANQHCPAVKQLEYVSEDVLRLSYCGGHTCGALGSSLSEKTIVQESQLMKVDSFKSSPFQDLLELSEAGAEVDANPVIESAPHADVGDCSEVNIASGSRSRYNLEVADMALACGSREACLTLRLDGISSQSSSILVGIRHQFLPPEHMQFFFTNPEEMAACIGIGVPNAVVVLDEKLQISVHEMHISDWNFELAFWLDKSDLDGCHFVMDFKQDETQQREQLSEVSQGLEQHALDLSSLHGISLDKVSCYQDETLDHSEVSGAILYDIASFAANKSATIRERTNRSKKSRRSAFETHRKRKRESRLVQGNLTSSKDNAQGGDSDGDDDGDGDFPGFGTGADDDHLPISLRVIVHTYPKDSVFDVLQQHDVELPCDGLEEASTGVELVFDFTRNRECRRICVTASTRLQLITEKSILYNNPECFGWYQNEVEMNLKSEGNTDDMELTRTVVLKHNSCKMLNPITSSKYTVANSDTLNEGENFSASGQVKVGLGRIVEVQGGLTGAASNETTRGSIQTIELTRDSICGGFDVINGSRSESPACAKFTLAYPLSCISIWHHKHILIGQGLFSSIEPKLTATFIPLNHVDHAPYSFSVSRTLKLHKRSSEINVAETIKTLSQSYLLSFFINHAMTHLRRKKGQRVELQGDPLELPRVIKVTRVY